MSDVQNGVSMINEVKQRTSEIDIDILKLMHNALEKVLKKWRDVILEMINSDNTCSKPDTKKKDNKPDTKKKGNKPDSKKKDNKPDTKKKPDTSKNDIKNKVSNRIKYEIKDIAKYRKVLIKMINDRMNMLDLTNLRLAESIEDTDTYENAHNFNRLCCANRIAF